ncbi:MAG: MMPL family transporter [Verrucomicrobiales bacterium]|nr:MMPL family transporter [Verrucomicrobiales bacterium]
MLHWILIILRARWLLAFLWVALAAGSVWLLPDLNFRFNLAKMLRGNDAQVSEIEQFYARFPPSDGHAMVTATSPDTLTINKLRSAEQWAENFRALPEVKRVISPGPLLNLNLDGLTLDQKAQINESGDEPLVFNDTPRMTAFRGTLVSRDVKSVALYLIRENGISTRQFHAAVESVDAPPWENAVIRVVGAELLLDRMSDTLGSNFRMLLLFECLAILLVIPVFMRSLRRAYLPFLVAFSALIFYLALFVLAGQEFGAMHLAGPGLILVIGLADAIHLQQKFDDARAKGKNVEEALQIMFRSVGQACVLTSLTTACGFLSLMIAPHEEIYEFGLWCAIGVATAFLTVIIFLPLALTFSPGKGSPARVQTLIRPRSLRRAAIPVTGLLVILSAGVYRTQLDSSLDRELPESVDVVRNANWFAEHFRGLDRIEVDLRADLLNREVVELVEEMRVEFEDFHGISGSQSYVDAFRYTLGPAAVESKNGPKIREAALGSGDDFPIHLLTRELDRACIVFYRTRDFGTERFEIFRDRIRDYEGQLPEGNSLKLTGWFPMFYDSTMLISRTMLLSLACSLSVITLILVIAFRSVKLGLLCLVPNAIPLLVVAGISGWMGEPLHLGILIVFSVGLGLAVDDTIHLIVRFHQLQKERPSACRRELMDEAIVSTGFAIVLTSAVLLVCSICFLGSSFTTMRGIGLTLGIVAVAALLADLIILPWLIEKFDRRTPRSSSASL